MRASMEVLVNRRGGAQSSLLRKGPGGQGRTGRHEYVLTTVHDVRRRRRAMHRGPQLVPPKQLAAPGIECEEVAFGIAAEDEARRRRQQARRRWSEVLE